MPRPISKFALTIPRYAEKDVLITILRHELQSTSWLVAAEEHHDQPAEGEAYALASRKTHLHAYFELNPDAVDTEIETVRQRLHSAFHAITGEESPGFDIQSAKRPDKWIKYITKVSTPVFELDYHRVVSATLLCLPRPGPHPALPMRRLDGGAQAYGRPPRRLNVLTSFNADVLIGRPRPNFGRNQY